MSIPRGAALGSTTDPRALVLGEPSSLDAAADALDREADTIMTVGTDLAAVRTPAWTGPASNGFWLLFGQEPSAWRGIAEVMTRGASAIRDQAGALRTAQDKAQQAVEKWQEGERASREARREYNSQVDDYNQRVTSGEMALPPGPFSDPGQTLRDEAQQILDDAVTALDQAGLDNAGTLAGLAGLQWNQSSGSADGPGVSTSTEGPRFGYGSDRSMYDRNAPWQQPSDASERDPRAELSLGTVSASAYLAQVQGRTEGNYQGIDYAAEGSLRAGADAQAGLSVTDEGLMANASASVGVTAEGSASAEYGYVGVQGRGSAFAGARADGEVSVGTSGVNASGEVFAGARAEGSAGVDVGGVGAQVTGEAWAGVGASAELDAGFQDGELTIGGSLGAGLGVGGKLGGEITIDVEEVTNTVEDVAQGVGDFAEGVGGGLSDMASGIGGALGL